MSRLQRNGRNRNPLESGVMNKAIYTDHASGKTVCYCRQCEWRFNAATNPLHICIFCKQNVELTMRRWHAAEKKRLADASKNANSVFNGEYRSRLTGSTVHIAANPHTWEKRTLCGDDGASFTLDNLTVSHLIASGLLERIEENSL